MKYKINTSLILTYITKHRITPTKFSLMVGMTKYKYNLMMMGDLNITVQDLINLAEILGKDISEVLIKSYC